MRILLISNYYPPLELGGWEQLTLEVSQRLAQRGHATAVLTSHYRAGGISRPEPGVHRLLNLESEDVLRYHAVSLVTKGHRERDNRRLLAKLVADWQPDAIFVHSMWNLPWTVAWQAERLMPGRVVYYMAGNWPYAPSAHEAYWHTPTRRRWLRPAKRLVASVPLALLRRERRLKRLRFEHVLCASRAVREDLAQFASVPFERSCVVYVGVDTGLFCPPPDWCPSRWKNGKPALLFAGTLIPAKGAHTAVEGFAEAVQLPELAGATLTVVGSRSGDPAYEAKLKQIAQTRGVAERVHFLERVERDQVPDLWRCFDILLVPSHFEAMPRILQEGMACGLNAIGTTVWGTGELLRDGETGLAFAPEDSDGLARQIGRLAADPELRGRLARAGRQAVVERFSQGRMIDEIEAYFTGVICGQGRAT